MPWGQPVHGPSRGMEPGHGPWCADRGLQPVGSDSLAVATILPLWPGLANVTRGASSWQQWVAEGPLLSSLRATLRQP